MKTKLLIVLGMLISSFNGICQDIFNPYRKGVLQENEITTDPTCCATYSWYPNVAQTGYSGEYEIDLQRHPWKTWENIVHFSYSMELVSFPFTPLCVNNSTGCLGVIGRPMYMPSTTYNSTTSGWGDLTNRFHRLDWVNTNDQSLISIGYKSDFATIPGPDDIYLPHSVIKHTIYLHCGPLTSQAPYPPILYSQSWVYDNTRGMMRSYPFCPQNGTIAGCGMSDWDVLFFPEAVAIQGHNYNFTQGSTWLANGTLDYFPYQEIQSLTPCGVSSLVLPNSLDVFKTSNSFNFPYFPPYSLLSSPLWQFRGEAIAGYSKKTNPNRIEPLNGIEHTYHIDQDINLEDIAILDRDFYNPSDVNVTTGNLRFPSYYTFKTIRGVYPSALQAQNDNTTINGGPYPDPRLVPVRTDLRCEDPAFPNDASILKDSRYASLYRMQAGSQITIEPCVKIFDAAFILHPGSTLKYENYNTQIGYVETDENISRVAIDRLGGRLIRQYDATLPAATLYLQDRTETAVAPNTYVVDERIIAGSNVDPNQNAGPYIASTGSDVELIANNYVKLSDGFIAQPGASLKVAIDAQMNIPACPPPRPASANRYAHPDIETSSPLKAKAVLAPNPIQQQAVITLLQSGQENYIRQIEVRDSKGQLLMRRDEVNKFSESIDMSTLPDGFYLITVITNNSSEVLKAVVNRN